MSEYQYYEFLAIERPLTAEEMAALHSLSTRADITAVSFINHYNWGDFKGNPIQLLERFFDAHVYVNNWGTAIFMVRLPIEVLEKEVIESTAVSYTLDFKATKTHWIITWNLEESENYDRFDMVDGRGWMARLAPVRDELLRGDIRSLYIGWLSAVTWEMVDDDEIEPRFVNGLGSLTSAQQALAEFLEVSPDLLAGAGMGTPDAPNEEISQKEVDEWIDCFPRNELKAIMRQLLDSQGQQAERTLKNRFAAWRRSIREDGIEGPRRTVRELKKNAEVAEKIRLDQIERDRKLLEIKRRKERKAYLNHLLKDVPKMWKSVQQTVERGSGLAYDEACRALIDISDAYALLADRNRFQQELKDFMADHMRRKALIQRLVKAGIWNDN